MHLILNIPRVGLGVLSRLSDADTIIDVLLSSVDDPNIASLQGYHSVVQYIRRIGTCSHHVSNHDAVNNEQQQSVFSLIIQLVSQMTTPRTSSHGVIGVLNAARHNERTATSTLTHAVRLYCNYTSNHLNSLFAIKASPFRGSTASCTKYRGMPR